MDLSPVGILKSLLPSLPSLLITSLLAILHLTPASQFQDTFTQLFVLWTRPILGRPISILKSQRQFTKNWIVFGRVWVARYVIGKCEDEVAKIEGENGVSVVDAVRQAIEFLGDEEVKGFNMPDVIDVETEWVGYRGHVSHLARRPNVPERAQYELMMREVEDEAPTVLYLHGGAFCLMDPAQFRFPLSWQAKRTKGRYLAVRYRLSPQYAFPSALLDAFMAYLSLLSPPSGAFHNAVPASQIVIAGDSSGGGLATSLLLLLLTLPKIGVTHVHFHGRAVPIALHPAAGLALNSPWLDISRALPSVHRNAKYDIIAPPSLDPYMGGGTPDFPHDAIWPTVPPRVETYCISSLVTHPLVSPLAASTDMWRTSPPVYVCVGWEFGQDETEVTMRRIYEAGGTVVFEGYVGLPHCFAILLFNEAATTAFDHMAAFCRDAAAACVKRRGHGTWTNRSGSVSPVKLEQLGIVRQSWEPDKVVLDDDTVSSLLAKSKLWRVQMEKIMISSWSRSSMSKMAS